MDDKEFSGIIDKLVIFEKMYEQIRFIDPIKKQVISYINTALNELPFKCYDFWAKSKACDNCISIRAFNENKSFVKIEYTPGEIYMVTAVPIEISDRRIVVELLKNATDSMVLDGGNSENNSEIYAMIDGINTLALRDPLTAVFNRRYINEKLPVDLVNTSLSGQSLSIIMADIDFFKKVNDTYGHLTGDCTLKSFTHILGGCIKRDSDWVARFGGEEFLICLPGAGLERAVVIAENMRRSVENNVIICGEYELKITASFGVHSIIPAPGVRIEDLIECADKKLYAAKNKGRNRVEA